MRLINVLTLELEVFNDPVQKPYAILSHRWEGDEVTFQDMQDLSIAKKKVASFSKIQATCRTALERDVHYAWVDTCCIDKSSSAELSEAINSMFRWYKNALYCFAFLSDVQAGSQFGVSHDLGKSRWFTRGWTLQELIAPDTVLFYDALWNFLDTKENAAENIETITGIDQGVLRGHTPLTQIPLAKRMSWAATRETTRVEDLAYCLLGIFDVNMPMLYGEGSRAFARLREEILKKTIDLSLFAWQTKAESKYRGILAMTPAEFSGCGKVYLNDDQFSFRDEISITNKGVKICTPLRHLSHSVYFMDLNCYKEEANGASTRIGIFLRPMLDTYFRHLPQLLADSVPGSLSVPIYLAFTTQDKYTVSSQIDVELLDRIRIDFSTKSVQYSVHSIVAVPKTYWHSEEQCFNHHGLHHFICFAKFSVTSSALPDTEYRTPTAETTAFILVCKLESSSKIRITLHTQTDLQNILKPERFIDPFTNIEQYGPLGDPFSLSVLSPGERENRRVLRTHRDHRHAYEVSASLDRMLARGVQITVQVSPVAQYQLDPL